LEPRIAAQVRLLPAAESGLKCVVWCLQNVMKLGHNKRAAMDCPEASKPPIRWGMAGGSLGPRMS